MIATIIATGRRRYLGLATAFDVGVIGMLGGLIGFSGAEFRLPFLIPACN
jgi:hypothetical protein